MMVVALTPRVYGCLDANFYCDPPYTALVGGTVTFNASTSTCDWNSTINYTYPIVRYDWDFGDGTTDIGEVVTHIYTGQGTYGISLEITDEKELRKFIELHCSFKYLQSRNPSNLEHFTISA